MHHFVGYKINTEAFEAITKDIIRQNPDEQDEELHSFDADEHVYDFIQDEEHNKYKDTYFPGFSSFKHLIITRYCGEDNDTIFVGYILKGKARSITAMNKELEAFKAICPPHLLLDKEPQSYTFEYM